MPWDTEKLLRQLELGEDSRVEFKEAAFKGGDVDARHREALANELAAFGNTIGGTLIFSISDAGEPRPMNRRQTDALQSFVEGICQDSIKPALPFVTEKLKLPEDIFVLVVEVEPSALVHKSPGGYFCRQGSTKRQMSSEALARLFQRRGRSGLPGPDEVPLPGTGPNTLEPDLTAPLPELARRRNPAMLNSRSSALSETTLPACPGPLSPEYCSAPSAPTSIWRVRRSMPFATAARCPDDRASTTQGRLPVRWTVKFAARFNSSNSTRGWRRANLPDGSRFRSSARERCSRPSSTPSCIATIRWSIRRYGFSFSMTVLSCIPRALYRIR